MCLVLSKLLCSSHSRVFMHGSQAQYAILKRDDVVQRQKKAVSEVTSILGLNEDEATRVLRKFKWWVARQRPSQALACYPCASAIHASIGSYSACSCRLSWWLQHSILILNKAFARHAHGIVIAWTMHAQHLYKACSGHTSLMRMAAVHICCMPVGM